MKSILLLLISINITYAKVIPKAIYGDDNRVEARDFHLEEFIDYSRSVPAMINKKMLIDQGDYYDFKKVTLKDTYKLCPGTRFNDQYSLTNCTGALVADDILITAGHCLVDANGCGEDIWYFGYEQGTTKLPKENFYTCKKIIHREVRERRWGQDIDYAVIQLDRIVEGVTPLKYRKGGRITKKEKVLVIGYPSGLPIKISDDSGVAKTFGKTFKTNLDTFEGNSGSPVFNQKTGLIEGVLVNGEHDLQYNLDLKCYENKKYSGKEETVFKVNKMKALKKYLQ